jgi:hypothetical protein
VTYLRGAGYQGFHAGWHVTLCTTTVGYGGLRWGCGGPATHCVSLGSDAGALDTPYSNTNTTIPKKGQAIPRQLSVEILHMPSIGHLLSRDSLSCRWIAQISVVQIFWSDSVVRFCLLKLSKYFYRAVCKTNTRTHVVTNQRSRARLNRKRCAGVLLAFYSVIRSSHRKMVSTISNERSVDYTIQTNAKQRL